MYSQPVMWTVFKLFFNIWFTESLFIPIEGWLSLLMTCHWTISFPSPSTLLLWKVSPVCEFDPSCLLLTNNLTCFPLMCQCPHQRNLQLSVSHTHFLFGSTFHYNILRKGAFYRNITHCVDFLCQSFVCRWWHQNKNKLPGRGVRAQTSFWVPHATFSQWGEQSMERYVRKHIKNLWCFEEPTYTFLQVPDAPRFYSQTIICFLLYV